MLTAEGPKVIEYNVRFGDPECQALVATMEGDLLLLLDAAARGAPLPAPAPTARAAVCVVVASGGYPGRHPTGAPIDGIDEAERVPGVVVFHAGTAMCDGRLVTAGRRPVGGGAAAGGGARAPRPGGPAAPPHPRGGPPQRRGAGAPPGP